MNDETTLAVVQNDGFIKIRLTIELAQLIGALTSFILFSGLSNSAILSSASQILSKLNGFRRTSSHLTTKPPARN